MTVGTREHAALANDAYNNRSKHTGRDKTVIVDGVHYKILAVADHPSGYQGTGYQREDTGEVVIAHRGTESLNDGITDAGMAVNGRNNQLDDAIAFTQRVMDEAKQRAEEQHQPLNITITGHSLGGTLAQITAAKYGLPAETFNAYGPASLKNLHDYDVDVNGRSPNIINHVRATDVVGAGSPHFGEVRMYAAPQDIESLRRGRYLESGSLHLPANPFLTADLSAHKMGNFLPHNEVTGDSIMNPVNEDRARAYRGAIEHYRQDVVQGRIDLTMVVHRAPSPLHALNPLDPALKLKLQAVDAGVTMTAQVVSNRVTEGVHVAGRTAQQVGHVVSDGVARAYDTLLGNKPATPIQTPAPHLDQPAHPDHAMFKQAQGGVHKLDAKVGRAPDQRSDQLAACLVVAARGKGMNRIDHVMLGTDTANVFAVQGALDSPFKQITYVPTVESLNRPIAQSTQDLEQVVQQQAQKSQQLQQHAQPPVQQQARSASLSR